MSLQIRRGTDAERLTITPLTAELIYTTDTQLVYVGDGVTVGGILVGDGGGNGTYGNANVVALLGSGVAGDIIPVGNSVYSLGSPTTQWKDLYISNNTIYINNVPLSANGNVITYDGVPLVSTNSSENISTSGNITGGNLILELSGAIVFPDGSTQTSAAQPYTDANVASFLASGTDTSNIVTTGNISGGYFIGNGSQLTGLPSGYANSDVAAFLASGNDTSNIITTANVSGAYIIGNGSSLSALTGANVTGQVAFAGTANSVAAANVVGSVANATFATTAGTADSVAGANVTGQVAHAAVANSVAGANVSGTVANATFATTAGTADSVAGANVSGPVGLATFATTANSVAGANVAGEVAHAAVANSVAGANVSGQVAFAAEANSVAGGNVVGTVASATTAETVTTAAQPNITSVGTLTGLSVSGNINAGTYHINNLADPSAAQDAATKAYVDATSSGLSVKGSVDLATTAPLSISYSYDNGVAGVGAFILATTVGQLVIDGVNASVGDRVLIKNEVGAYVDDNTPSAAFNGIYVVLDDGVSNAFQLERATDCDTAAEIPAAYTLVTGGTTLINTGWVDDNTSSMVVGATSINFVQFSSVTTYSGGSAIDVTGTVISAKYDGTTIVTNGSNQLEVGTVPGTSISGTVASATVAASANSVAGANVSGEVGFAAVANLVAGGNVSGAVGLADFATTANSVAGGNVTGEVAFAAVANTVAGANVSGQVANALVAATVYDNAQPNITSVGTLVDLTVTGNVTGDYFIGNGSQLTGLPAGYANSDVANYLASNANVVITTTGNITTTANVEAGFFIGDGSQLTNLPPVAALSIPAVYFNVVADGNNQTFSNTVLSAYTSNTEITLFYNGALLDSPYYTLSGDTLTINTDLSIGDSIDVIRQFASNVIVSTYSNSDVSAYLASGNDTSNIITTGNISGAYFIGNGSQLTGLPSGYSNADVSTYLASGTDTAGIITTGNVQASHVIGNGSSLTSLTGANVTGEVAFAAVANSVAGANVTGIVANATFATTAGTADSVAGANVTGTVASALEAASANSVAGANVVGEVSSAALAGSVTTNSQPNITSVGTLTSLAMSGNINAGTYHINNLSDPVAGQDAATKSYVDAHSSGLSVKGSSALATTAPLSATYTYNNGTAGVGATITASTTGQLVIDGVNATVGARVLIKNEVGAYVNDTTPSAAFNGIYVVTDDGSTNPFVLTRATDCDTAAEIPSAYTLVTGGSTLANTGWVDDNAVGLTVGTTSINFVQFSSVTTYSGGSGIDVTGTVISALYDGTTITTNGSDQLVVATVPGANISGTVASATVAASANSVAGANVSGEVAFAATANSVAGANVSGAVANATHAVTADTANSVAVANVVGIGNIATINLNGNASTVLAGNGDWIAQTGTTTGNVTELGVPQNSNLTANVAYTGWTPNTFVTDGLDDLNQVTLNVVKNTYVGQINFTANVTAGPSPTTVQFTGTYVGNPNSYYWDFGDGNTSTSGAVVNHTYSDTAGGQFNVTFRAYNTTGTFAGNAAAGARGSVDSTSKTGYITLYTPLPIPAFTTSPTSLDSGNSITITNTSQYASSYSINYGDGNTVTPSNVWTTDIHQYINSANTDSLYNVVLTGTSETAGPTPPYNVNSAATPVKVYSLQSPALTANTLTVVNFAATSGGIVSFRNDTPGSPGSTATFGAQQKYNYQWGDGTANSNINIQSGLAGNPGAANITHTFALTAGQQTAGTSATYTANLWLYTGYSTSPFQSANVTITVEPEVRAGFTGTANVVSDRTGDTAQTGYVFVDYNGNDRSLFNFQNSTSPTPPFTGNSFSWSWGDTTFSNTTSSANVSHTYATTGSKTVALTANGSPGTISQSNTRTNTNYITINANPVAPGNLSTKTLSLTTASQGTNPLLAAGAADNTGGAIVANGTSVTRYVTSTPIVSSLVATANTSTTGTLSALISGTTSGSTSFSTSGNAVGTYTSLVVALDADAHVAISASTYPSYFYKVFSAQISTSLASLSVGYNNYKLQHTVSGDTNAVGFVKDNLSTVATLSNASVVMTETTPGTYRYISGVPYYNTGSPVISIQSIQVGNLTGQTYANTTTPMSIASGTNFESTTGTIIATQTKTYAQLDGSVSMLTSGIPNANVGIGSNYTLGNQSVSINGSARAVATIQANIINVNGTSTTVQMPTKVQVYSLAITGVNEESIPVSALLGTVYSDNGVRITGFGTASNTPAFSGATNYYTTDAWSGAETVAGTQEAIVRWGTLQHFNSTNFSTGYLPAGPDLVTGRSGTQYFTIAFRRATVSNFDIILSGKVSGVWIAAPGTQIDTTSSINGWLDCSTQYAGSGIPGANLVAGGNGSDGCALTGADRVPVGTTVTAQRYTQTLGEENSSNSTGNNILVRIALAPGDSITDFQIGVAT